MRYISNNINNINSRYWQAILQNKPVSIPSNKPVSIPSNKPVSIPSNKNKSTTDSRFITSDTYTKLAHQLGYNDYYVADGTPITVHSERFGVIHNGHELLAKFYEYNRKQLNQKINDALDKNGIKLSDNEKLNFTIDENQAIKVTGAENEERCNQIEQALNNSGNNNISELLTSSILAVNSFNGLIDQQKYDKWEAAKLLKEQTGLNLEDLKMVDGKIIGGNEKFDSIADINKNFETNESNYINKLMVKKVTTVLSYGINNIEDINFSIDFQNGKLIDKNVKYGFNSNDLNKWLTDVSGNSWGIDISI